MSRRSLGRVTWKERKSNEKKKGGEKWKLILTILLSCEVLALLASGASFALQAAAALQWVECATCWEPTCTTSASQALEENASKRESRARDEFYRNGQRVAETASTSGLPGPMLGRGILESRQTSLDDGSPVEFLK